MDWRIPLFLLAPVSSLFAQRMELGDVRQVLAQAVQEAMAISPAENRVIAITDREGHVLAVWDVNGAAEPNPTPLIVSDVVSKAGAAAFLSSNQHAFTSRTAAFIVQRHFPPGVANRPNGPLVGVNFSSMAFSDTNKYKAPHPDGTFPLPPVPGVDADSATPADRFRSVPFTSLLTGSAAGSSPGGVPLFKNGVLVGGIGVVGFADTEVKDFDIFFEANINERIALSGQAGFRPAPVFGGNNVAIDGVRLAYVVGAGSDATVANPVAFLAANGSAVNFADIDGIPGPASADNNPVDYSPKASPPAVVYPNPFGFTGPGGVPGELRSAIRGDPLEGTTIAGAARLSAAEVEGILRLAAERSQITRAGIRLPRGQITQVWISVVNNPNAAGVEPVVLGTYRTPDATIFSWDVAVQKARTALFFSRGLERGTPRAFSSRSVGFLAQEFYPPGIGGNPSPDDPLFAKQAGPLFGLQGLFSLQGGAVPSAPINLNVPNGITIFPGGFPLYRNGVLVGAIGVSGDGIEQDDIVGASGAKNFLAPPTSRADNLVYERARLPYARFPRASSSF